VFDSKGPRLARDAIIKPLLLLLGALVALGGVVFDVGVSGYRHCDMLGLFDE
jgi:hypothetical protein